MLTTAYRPKTFQEIVGQQINVDVLRCVTKEPESSPRVFIFQGDFGTGKTTAARAFARALNCTYGNPDPCADCDTCKADMDFCSYYRELDSATVGSKESIQQVKDDFFYASSGDTWRVVVFDEFHLTSRPAQASLLKALEGLPRDLFVIFCTTRIDRIVPALRSRAVELVFQPVGHEDMVLNLTRIAELEEIEIRPALIDLICRHSHGHVRDSVMLLDVYKSLDHKPDFLHHLRSCELDLIHLLTAIRKADREVTSKLLAKVMTTPLDTLRSDLYRVIHEGLKLYATREINSLHEEEYQEMAKVWRADLVKLLGFSTSEWAVNAFTNDQATQAFFWSAFLSFGKVKQQAEEGAREGATDQPSPDSNRFRKK